jgi:1,4-dihydroxy-2-naphthoyl-CoA synthase
MRAVGHNAAMPATRHVSDPGVRWAVPDPRVLALRIRLRAVRMVAPQGFGYLGQALSSEIVLMCDITLAAEDAVLFDLHYDIGSVPADGIHNAFQELLGVKRAAYALLTGEAITARQALEWGMVNEVLPLERLVERAYQIADHIMTQPRTVRRLTTQIVRRPWKQRIVNDLDGGFGIQMFGHVAKKRAVHGEQHIRSTVDYVREGRKNNFD